jgi:hypothetical protein
LGKDPHPMFGSKRAVKFFRIKEIREVILISRHYFARAGHTGLRTFSSVIFHLEENLQQPLDRSFHFRDLRCHFDAGGRLFKGVGTAFMDG